MVVAYEATEHPVQRTLALASRLVETAEALAAELPPIDLPPSYSAPDDQSNLLTVAPLYLAAEFESAQLLPAVELLTGLYATGALALDDVPSGRLMEAFWTQRQQRFTPPERRAFFSRLFGTFHGPSLGGQGGANAEFDTLMIDFSEALYKIDLDPSGARVRATAGGLLSNVLPRSSGMTLFAARDILTAIQAALDIVGKPAVQHLVGAHGAWSAVAETLRRYTAGGEVDIHSHVTRGQAGTLVFAWLANHLADLDGGEPLLHPQDPVVSAAAAWLESTLTLRERASSSTARAG